MSGTIERLARVENGRAAAAVEDIPADADAFCRSGRGQLPVRRRANSSPSPVHRAGSTSSAASPTTRARSCSELPLASAALAAAQLGRDGARRRRERRPADALDVDDLVGAAARRPRRRFAGPTPGPRTCSARSPCSLREERGPPGGLRLLVSSDVPEGKGVGLLGGGREWPCCRRSPPASASPRSRGGSPSSGSGQSSCSQEPPAARWIR